MENSNSMIKSIPGFNLLRRTRQAIQSYSQINSLLSNPFIKFSFPGHFYSPLPDLQEILRNEQSLFKKDSNECSGIDLCESEQVEFLDQLAIYYSELPFPNLESKSYRYFYENQYFRYADAIILYSILRHFKPKRVIEIGSGFSSSVMLDTHDLFLPNSIHFSFIEPYPDRLYSLLNEKDQKKCHILPKLIQDVELALFDNLDAGDILFIDSSHVAKIGSDVCHILFKILPRLKPGVIIHFHDIFWPFEYPRDWVTSGRAWNEAYILRAFLQYNSSFRIRFFNSFMGLFHQDLLKQKMPLYLQDTGGSLWLTKMSPRT